MENCDVGSSEAVDSVHVETEVRSMCIVVLQSKVAVYVTSDFVVANLQVTLLFSVTKRNA